MGDALQNVSASSYDVSVIVPMYNVERYLPQCVESLLAQTLGSKLQVVLVDDGSPDKSGALGDEYAARYGNVICIHRENGGLGPARNTGIAHAEGRYIGFVDSDDWVDESMYESLLAAAEASDADVAYSGMRTVVGGVETQVFPQPYGEKVFSGDDEIVRFRNTFFGAAPAKVVMEPMQVSVCPALYRASIIRAFNVRFENIRSEDITFNLDFLARTSRIACVDDVFYNYRKEDQVSITTTFREGTVDEYFELFDKVAARLPLENEPGYADAVLRFDRRVIDCCRGMLVSVYTQLDADKCDLIAARVLTSQRLTTAMRGYPWREVPCAQGIFLLAMKYKRTMFLRLLSELRFKR